MGYYKACVKFWGNKGVFTLFVQEEFDVDTGDRLCVETKKGFGECVVVGIPKYINGDLSATKSKQCVIENKSKQIRLAQSAEGEDDMNNDINGLVGMVDGECYRVAGINSGTSTVVLGAKGYTIGNMVVYETAKKLNNTVREDLSDYLYLINEATPKHTYVTVGVVIEVLKPEDVTNVPSNFILSSVITSEAVELKSKIDTAKNIVRQLEDRRKKLHNLEVYRSMAERDLEAKNLLESLEALIGG